MRKLSPLLLVFFGLSAFAAPELGPFKDLRYVSELKLLRELQFTDSDPIPAITRADGRYFCQLSVKQKSRVIGDKIYEAPVVLLARYSKGYAVGADLPFEPQFESEDDPGDFRSLSAIGLPQESWATPVIQSGRAPLTVQRAIFSDCTLAQLEEMGLIQRTLRRYPVEHLPQNLFSWRAVRVTDIGLACPRKRIIGFFSN